MGRFAGLNEKHLSSRTSKSVNLDNGTMVEALKYLNYRQLATNSLVSNRFRDVIETHRDQLALLFVTISMQKRYGNGLSKYNGNTVRLFNEELTPKDYKEWVARNNYSKRIPLKGQAADNPSDYELSAHGKYNGPNQESTRVFFARVKAVNHKTWPLFQHFVCLLSDPFVYIHDVKLTSQADVFNLLAATIDINHGRLQCKKLEIDIEDNAQKFLIWIKSHMRCVNFQIAIFDNSANRDNELLDFFVTGSDCTSEIVVRNSDFSKDVIVDFVQKFMDLKSCDESKIVRSIRTRISKLTAEALKSDYAKFFLKEKKYQFGFSTAHVFELVNVDTGKKLHLTVTSLRRLFEEIYDDEPPDWVDIVIS